jgi:putative thioredoxin
MSESAYIHNVGAQDFQALVIENSYKQPVLIDFWADWCEPCKSLAPVLARLAEEYNGKFILAKVDTEKEQELAAHFGIKSLPTMKVIFNGQIAGERVGAIPESEIRALIDPLIISESDKVMDAAMAAHNEGRTQDALDLMNQALANDPANLDLKINIARLVMLQGDMKSASALLDSLSDEESKNDEAVKLRAKINLDTQLEGLPSMEQIESRLADNPEDLEALLDKSHHLSASGLYEQSMEILLEIMTIDRKFQDDAGRKGLLALFDMLGSEQQAVQKYRRKLFTLLH